MMKRISTLGPIGYLPASGTWASLLTVGGIYVLHQLHVSWIVYGLITGVIGLIGLYTIKVCQSQFKQHDPAEIVIDEVLGCLIAFLGVPFNGYTAFMGFSLFRFFDITKIFGIRRLEKQGKITGVLLDDVGAGVASNVVMQMLVLMARHL